VQDDAMPGGRIPRNEAYTQYAAMTKDEAQRRRTLFQRLRNEVVTLLGLPPPVKIPAPARNPHPDDAYLISAWKGKPSGPAFNREEPVSPSTQNPGFGIWA